MSEISKIDQNFVVKKIDSETINLQINDNEMLMAIVGQFDQNLKDLSKFTKTDVYFRLKRLLIELSVTIPSLGGYVKIKNSFEPYLSEIS